MNNTNKKFDIIKKQICYEVNKIYQSIKHKKISYKNKGNLTIDPVSYFDLSIEKKIRKIIIKEFPNHSIIGEELKPSLNNSKYKWYIDPIDGTKSFIMGLPNWSNLVGLYYNSTPIFSMAYFPVLEKLYFTKGNQNYLQTKDGTKRIHVNKYVKTNNVAIAFNTFRSIKEKKIFSKLSNFKFLFKITGVDSLNFCLLTEGKIDLLIEKGLKPVDYLPLMKLIKNSGAVITDWKGKNKYPNGDVIVAANKTIYNYFYNKLFK